MLPARLRTFTLLFLIHCVTLTAAPAAAQQTGAIQGKVVDAQGGVLPGVTVEARSDVLPGPRVTTTESDGVYHLPALPPGEYTVTFTLSGMRSSSKKVRVLLAEAATADATLAIGGVTETVNVTAEAALIDRTSATISSGIPTEQISRVPVGTQYRDLIRLLPGVQVTPDAIRGPSAGSSGQDNTYKFDGVNVTMPLFGTLSAEPAAHDIAQVTVIKGGAKAVDFDRAGGFAVDSVSKSGTNRFSGQASFRFQYDSMSAALNTGVASRYDKDQTWTDLNIGGPLLRDRVLFYASYYRPEVARNNAATKYGSVPSYRSTRNEGFGKVTVTPRSGILLNGSYRKSHRRDKGDTFGAATAGTAGSAGESSLDIATADGSWVLNGSNFISFKYTHFANPGKTKPDNIASAVPNTTIGTHIDVNGLDQLGQLTVPVPGANAAVNAFIAPFITRYGYVENGVSTGGGIVGFATQTSEGNYYRDAAQVGYNVTLNALGMRHMVHAAYQQYVDSEDLIRTSNGWGSLSIPGGNISFNGTPIFFQASFIPLGSDVVPRIHSEFRARGFEANDTITWANWTVNVGLLASNDRLYGQGLKRDPSTLSGFVRSTATDPEGRRYLMYEVPWSKLLQPRLSTTWAYNGKDTLFVSFARYNPAASSLPRAASWDRNLVTTLNANFDANGNLFGVQRVESSSGKLFVADLTPARHDEWIVGTARQFGNSITGRAYFRYNRGSHYWEDTNNTARVTFSPPPTLPGTDVSIPQAPYIADLTQRLAQIGSGSSYVIAELDGAFTRYRELTLESEYRKGRAFVRGSMTFSRYYGNFDQDNSSIGNDDNIFIGSSNIGDGAGRQLWDNKLGTLRGDRPFAMKVFGAYALNWNASVGAFMFAQSGQPWEMWSYEPYRALTTNTSDTDRYAEPAGSRRSPSHYQFDLNYTQSLRLRGRSRAVIAADVFNIFNKQTGYNYQPGFHASTFGQPRNYFDPARLEMTIRLEF
jgi:hypothetical protein